MTAPLTPAQKAARRAAKLRGQRLAAASPYHHEPVPDPVRPKCRLCGEPMYGTGSCHAQCAFEEAIQRRWEEGRPPADPNEAGRQVEPAGADG
jgi:hypothetical protein